MTYNSFLITALLSLFLISFFPAAPSVSAYPSLYSSSSSSSTSRRLTLVSRQSVEPYFPDTPVSCPICARDYPSINSCAQAAPVLANFTSVLFNPGAFIDVIKCSCTNTFQSTFPQCVDCFEQTNQTAVLDTPDLSSLVNNIRKVCAFASSILGNVSNTNGETTPTHSTTTTTPSSTATGTTNAALSGRDGFGGFTALLETSIVVLLGTSLL
ncbi:hypothetical protein B0F90DRAFT_699330 [Multifurca ochricompacta]|uniref:Uncharacterized protein n=1 Tax=Multifurca ochricompacta TaxID=376703 RepID=A0AAD4LUC4_9AGAM|nr:hypothetical protein B0F90DRAFT_699330 [Multifurca ochricompacta]